MPDSLSARLENIVRERYRGHFLVTPTASTPPIPRQQCAGFHWVSPRSPTSTLHVGRTDPTWGPRVVHGRLQPLREPCHPPPWTRGPDQANTSKWVPEPRAWAAATRKEGLPREALGKDFVRSWCDHFVSWGERVELTGGRHAEHEVEAKTTENRGERKKEMGALVTSLEPPNLMTWASSCAFWLSHFGGGLSATAAWGPQGEKQTSGPMCAVLEEPLEEH